MYWISLNEKLDLTSWELSWRLDIKLFENLTNDYDLLKSEIYEDQTIIEKITSDISFSIDLLERQTKHLGISVAIPTEFMSERKKIIDFCSLFKELNELVHGFN